MTFITVRNVGAYGFHTTPLNGIGLGTAEATTTRSNVDQALALADALRAAMQAARQAGLQAFAPAQAVAVGVLTLPASLSTANREDFFANVMGRAYAGAPVSLDQWSHAVEELEHWAGATASMLPPGAGGGTRNVRGTWYVNGEPWSLSELFTVNRVNTLAEIDRMVADSLNVIAANNDAAKALTGLMQKLFKKYYENQWDSSTIPRYTKVSRTWVNAVGTLDQDAVPVNQRNPWTEGNERIEANEGAPKIDYAVSFSKLLEYAEKHIGPGTMISKMDTAGTTNPDGSPNSAIGLGKEDFRAMIDEVEQILGAFSSDNQVAQLRNETLFNSRSNLLEGLGTFLKGQQTTRSTLARNA